MASVIKMGFCRTVPTGQERRAASTNTSHCLQHPLRLRRFEREIEKEMGKTSKTCKTTSIQMQNKQVFMKSFPLVPILTQPAPAHSSPAGQQTARETPNAQNPEFVWKPAAIPPCPLTKYQLLYLLNFPSCKFCASHDAGVPAPGRPTHSSHNWEQLLVWDQGRTYSNGF